MDTPTQTLMERHRQEAVSRRDELLPAVEEFNQLEDYLSSFTGGTRRRSATRSGTGTKRRQSRNGNGPNRADQFLAVVEANPGVTIPQIAEKINEHLGEGERPVSGNYLYRVRDALTEEGKIEVEGDGFKATKAAKK